MVLPPVTTLLVPSVVGRHDEPSAMVPAGAVLGRRHVEAEHTLLLLADPGWLAPVPYLRHYLKWVASFAWVKACPGYRPEILG